MTTVVEFGGQGPNVSRVDASKHSGLLIQGSAVRTLSPATINYQRRLSLFEFLQKPSIPLAITEVSQLEAFTGSYDKESPRVKCHDGLANSAIS